MRTTAVLVLICALAGAHGTAISPVQKVVELLEGCKAKVEKDLAAEATAMEEYTTFCDDELAEKSYAIEKAGRGIMDLSATVEDSTATVAELEDEITGLGSELAAKDRELSEATARREEAHANFVAAEKTMVESVEELGRAVGVLKQVPAKAALLQGQALDRRQAQVQALSAILAAASVDSASKAKLSSFLQAAQKAADKSDEQDEDPLAKAEAIKQEADDDDDDLDLNKAMSASDASFTQTQAKARQAPKAAAFESKSGGILETVEGMEDKAEEELSELRKKETADQQSFELIAQGLENEIKHLKDKTAEATSNKAASTETLADAQAKLVETKKAKAADEEYSASLKTDCETKATEWAERQKSAAEETAAIEKAKEILVSGVKEFVQIAVRTRRTKALEAARDPSKEVRRQLASALRELSRTHHSFALSQLAARAASDPFVKIRGLIEDMINKLLKEASEDATHEAFCEEEMAKSKSSQDDKTAKLEKFKTRIDSAETTIAELASDVAELTKEIKEIDTAMKEALEIRTKDAAEFAQASKDYKDSAEAVARAIEVLKSFYESSLIQVSERRSLQRAGARARQPEFGSAKSDTSHTIISVLEMSQDDFTTLLAEAESTESEAVRAFTKLSNENKIAKAAKQSEIKAKESEMKTLKVTLENGKEDAAVAQEELDAVLAYLDKLKPECESKAMSYGERKAAREAEIQGLKDALEILEGKAVLLQTSRHLRSVRARA